MIKSYLKTIFRQIQKHKLFSFINILGLALGMAACLVIAQYVNFHYSFDSYHTNYAKIYRIENNATQGGQELDRGFNTPDPMTVALAEESRHVQAIAKFYDYNYANNSIIYDGKEQKVSFEQDGVYVSSAATFDVFDFPIAYGDLSKFDDPQKLIMTRAASVKYFSDLETAIGSNLTLSGNNGASEYELIAILEDLPNNSHIQFEVLLSYPSIDNYTTARKSWASTA